MHNRYAHAGCDVSKDHLDVCLRDREGRHHTQQFDNTPAGHTKLLQWVRQVDAPVRFVLEATGNYSLDPALALHEAQEVELMVANPRAIKKFAGAQMRRSKTDQVDAEVICDFARRMEFVPWQPPEEAILELRGMARRMQALTVERTRELARLRHAEATMTTPAVVVNDIGVNLRHLERRLDEMLRQALKVVRAHDHMQEAFEHVTSVRGIAEKSAVMLLPELLILPEQMTVRQWVAHAGLDPRKHQSGESVSKPDRISKVGNANIRRALYMPAWVAVRWEPNVGAFYDKLIARGKKPMVAIVAVMRKLLHSIYGMLKHNSDFDGDKFYQMPVQTA